jgi:hypothetical protein
MILTVERAEGFAPAGTALNFRAAFIALLFIATLSTVFLFPAFPRFFRPSAEAPHLSFVILGWFSTAHVATTALFYIDKGFAPHIRQRKVRYIWAPAFIVIASLFLWGAVGTGNHSYLWLFFTSWLLWHYQRQNVGITSLVSSASKGDRITPLERKIMMAAGVAGIIAALRFKADALPFVTAENMRMAGGALYSACAAAGAVVIVKRLSVSARRNWPGAAFIMASIVFFAPTFLQTGFFPAVTSYAVAHALQYWLLMTYLAVSSARSNGWLLSIGGFFILVAAIWAVIFYSRNGDLWGPWANYLLGLQFGITMAHFIVDADAWRMSESFQRNYLLDRYAHFFGRR